MAVLENYQNEDGSVDVPEALRFDTEGRVSVAPAVNQGAAAPL